MLSLPLFAFGLGKTQSIIGSYSYKNDSIFYELNLKQDSTFT
jgi:hypothetical protein